MSFPNDLAQRIRAGRCVLVAGNRLGSVPWKALMDGLLERLKSSDDSRTDEVSQLAADGKVATVLGHARRVLGADAVREVAREAAPDPDSASESITKLMAHPWSAIITTRLDDTLTRGSERVFTFADVDGLRNAQSPFSLRLLGDPASTDVVLTPADFRERVFRVEPLRAVIEDLYRRRSFVLIGFDREDPDFHLIRSLIYSFEETRVDHWARIEGVVSTEAEEICSELGFTSLEASGELEAAMDELTAAVAEAPEIELPPEADLPAADDLEGWLKILTENPTSVPAREALDVLEAKLREWRDWDKLVLLLLGKMDTTQDAGGRADVLREVATIFEHEVGDLGKAFHTLRAAFREQPTADEIAAELERLAAATGQWSDLIRDYTEQALTRQDKQVAIKEWMRIARLAQKEANQPESAVDALKQVLRLEPGHEDAGRDLRHALRQAKRWAELAEALVQQADSMPPLEGAGTLQQAAELYETRVGDMDLATECYRRVLAADRRNRAAQTAAARIYRARELWEPLVKVLELKLDSVEGEEALETRREIADLLANKLEDPEGAISQHKKIRELQPSDVRALRALEQLYDQTGKTESYLEVLERLSETVDDEAERVSLRLRMAAELEEVKGGRSRAIPHLERALSFDPGHIEAHRTLVRLLRDERRFADLRTELSRRLPFTTDAAERLSLHTQIARLSEEELDDAEGAQGAWEKVIEADAGHRDARRALEKLYVERREYQAAVQMLDRAIQSGLSDAERVEIHERLGSVLREHLHDYDDAERHFAKALEYEPRNISARLSLVEMYRARGDSLRAALLLCEAEQQTQNRIERVRYLVEAAELYAAAGDPDRARELLRSALDVDPEHFEAAGRLADLLEDQDAGKEQLALLEIVLRKTDAQDRAGRLRNQVRIARLSKRLGDSQRALTALRAAHEIDPTDVGTLGELGPLLMEHEQWEEAARTLQAMLAHHVDRLSKSERVALYTRLGTCIQKQGDESRAVHFFEKALEVEPEHQEAMRALVEIHARRSDPSALLRMKKALVRVATQEERYRLWLEIGDLARHLGQHAEASGAYKEAMASRPGTGNPLHRLLELATATQNWQEAVDILDKLADVESDPEGRSTVRYSAAVILRDHMRKEDEALERFEAAWIDNPAHPKALAATDKILQSRGDWENVADAYRNMLSKAPSDRCPKERAALWHMLGDVLRQHIDDPTGAIDAYEEANKLEGPTQARQDELVRLYLKAGPERIDKAIDSVQETLRIDSGRMESYRQLADLYDSAGKADRAFCVASAMRVLGIAEEAQNERFTKHRPADAPKVSRRLGEEAWARLRHPDQDARIGAAFAALANAAAAMAARSPRSLGLNVKRRVNLDSDDRRFFALIRDAAPRMEVDTPDVYERADLAWPRLVAVREDERYKAALVVGASLLDGRPPTELSFAAVKSLAYLRPEHRMVWAVPVLGAQRALLSAAASLVAGGKSSGSPEQERIVGELRRRLSPAEIRAIESIENLASLPDSDLARYASAVDMTCTRIATLLCGDLETAARIVANEPPLAGARPARDRVRDLVAFYVSPAHMESRDQLGLAVS